MRPRACAAILRNDTILMVRHQHDGRSYWTLPGGGIEPGETPAQAAVREVREETGLDATVVRLLFEEAYLEDGSICSCFLLTLDGDSQQPALGHDPEEAHQESETRMLQEVAWISLDRMRDDGQVAQVLKTFAESG